jgi:hypothetical protein
MQKELNNLLYITLAILILLLSTINLSMKPRKEIKVLGVTTDNSFWEEMVIKHPTYRDARWKFMRSIATEI